VKLKVTARSHWARVFALAGITALAADAAVAAPVGDPRLNGFWNIDAAYREQSQRNAKAELTPTAQVIADRNAAAQRERLARGQVVGLNSYTCGNLGVPFFINTSEPWHLIVDEEAATQVLERRQITPRRFYLDGRQWPDFNQLPPSSQGYSIAHWEGKDLVIQTRDMPEGGLAGGGMKGPNTVLTERVSVSEDGKRLRWALSWSDPELLVQPYGWDIMYDRAPQHTYALTHDCDPNQGAGQTVEEPEQD
jgi:hypothetical protein